MTSSRALFAWDHEYTTEDRPPWVFNKFPEAGGSLAQVEAEYHDKAAETFSPWQYPDMGVRVGFGRTRTPLSFFFSLPRWGTALEKQDTLYCTPKTKTNKAPPQSLPVRRGGLKLAHQLQHPVLVLVPLVQGLAPPHALLLGARQRKDLRLTCDVPLVIPLPLLARLRVGCLPVVARPAPGCCPSRNTAARTRGRSGSRRASRQRWPDHGGLGEREGERRPGVIIPALARSAASDCRTGSRALASADKISSVTKHVSRADLGGRIRAGQIWRWKRKRMLILHTQRKIVYTTVSPDHRGPLLPLWPLLQPPRDRLRWSRRRRPPLPLLPSCRRE